MREIKFRVWDRDNAQMVYSSKGYVGFFEQVDGWDWYDTLMQFTGLKDKNGVEIYEGDILGVELAISPDFSHDFRLPVIWDDEAVAWSFGAGVGVSLTHTMAYRFENGVGEDVEVIGNIYANGELLNGGTK